MPAGRSGGGAMRCNREFGGLGPDDGDVVMGCDVPVNFCTRDRKSLGSVLYTVGASRGCANVGRRPFLILLDDLFTASDLLPPFPKSPASPRSIDMDAAMRLSLDESPTAPQVDLLTPLHFHKQPVMLGLHSADELQKFP